MSPRASRNIVGVGDRCPREIEIAGCYIRPGHRFVLSTFHVTRKTTDGQSSSQIYPRVSLMYNESKIINERILFS